MSNSQNVPDKILQQVLQAERESKIGRLKIYLGMCAGVGKTYAMLSDAIRERNRGVDIIIGYVELHGRPETEALAAELPSMRMRNVIHRGKEIGDFDLDEALNRHPTCILVDELAHTNAPGSRHHKRWQDVQELLRAGIHVYTTLNIQHLESLNDIVSGITGVVVRETVPDFVVASANSIEVVDIPPEELLQRIAEGKVYRADKIDSAQNNFFRKGNLIALRELVLRHSAERVEEQMQRYRDEHYVREVWPTATRVLVCIAPNAMSTRVVRAAARMAANARGKLIALSVESSHYATLSEKARQQAFLAMKLAESLGAEIIVRTSEEPVTTILEVANQYNVSSIVLGKPKRRGLREFFRRPLLDELLEKSKSISLHVIPTSHDKERKVQISPIRREAISRSGMGRILLTIAASSLICQGMYPYFELVNLVMVYLLGVAWLALKLNRVEAMLAAVLSVSSFDFFFVPPRFSFVVSDAQYVVTFLVMLGVAICISSLTLRVRAQARIVSERENRTSALLDFTKRLADAKEYEEIAAIIKLKLSDIGGGESVLLLPDDSSGDLRVVLPSSSRFEDEPTDRSAADWVQRNRLRGGKGTDTLPNSLAHYFPLNVGESCVGVAGFKLDREELSHSESELIESYCGQLALALSRIREGIRSNAVRVESERERLRNTLLSSVSHDFRTPLAAISGVVSTLLERRDLEPEKRYDLLLLVNEQTNRLTRMVRNVLDITRVESPSIRLNFEWNSLEELVGSAISRTEMLLEGREVSVQLDERLPLLLLDASLIEQVIVNLLENVAKHTPAGTPVHIVGCSEEGSVILSVEDRGDGIPENERERIFEKLYRHSTGASDGFGLGLAVCRGIMIAHHGGIKVLEREGGGSRFVLKIPIDASPPKVAND